jgi:HlyD family secretion protein
MEELSSPEQLDRGVRLTSPKHFLFIISFVIIFATLMVWGFYGTIPKKYKGMGMIMSSSGTVSVQSTINGILSDVAIEKGDYVYPGSVIARINSQETIEEITRLEEKLADLTGNVDVRYGSEINKQVLEIEKKRKEIEILNDKINGYQSVMASYAHEVSTLDKKVASNKILLEHGAISKEAYDRTLIERNDAKISLDDYTSTYQQALEQQKIIQLELEQLEIGIDTLENDLYNNEDIMAITKEIDKLVSRLDKTKIVANVEGEVMRVNATENHVVQVGQEVATLIEKGSNVNNGTVIFYLSINEGKALIPGMEVKIYPTIYNRQEYGHMKGIISEVSDYAVSTSEIEKHLGSPELVNQLAQSGALIQVESNIIRDENSLSGYYWSSKKGQNVYIDEGTMCEVSVVIEENKPISLVIPILKEKLLP